MNLIKLKEVLEKKDINSNSYSLDEGEEEDTYCIENTEEGWSVFYYERGNKHDEKKFSYESDACKYFLEMIIKDPSTKKIDQVNFILKSRITLKSLDSDFDGIYSGANIKIKFSNNNILIPGKIQLIEDNVLKSGESARVEIEITLSEDNYYKFNFNKGDKFEIIYGMSTILGEGNINELSREF